MDFPCDSCKEKRIKCWILGCTKYKSYRDYADSRYEMKKVYEKMQEEERWKDEQDRKAKEP